MSKSNLHTVPGFAAVRKSPRAYTHAVVGNWPNESECVFRWSQSFDSATSGAKYYVGRGVLNVRVVETVRA
jgi:hypothetical protein